MHLKNWWKKMRHDNWLYNYSPPFGDYNYWHYVRKPWEYFECLYRTLRWFYQRGTKGYCERDVWSLDCHLTSYMGNALRDLAGQVQGTPIIDTGRVFTDPNDCDTFTIEEWKATILYLAETFDIGRSMEDFKYLTTDDYQNAKKRFDHGMAMFSEYFFYLWD